MSPPPPQSLTFPGLSPHGSRGETQASSELALSYGPLLHLLYPSRYNTVLLVLYLSVCCSSEILQVIYWMWQKDEVSGAWRCYEAFCTKGQFCTQFHSVLLLFAVLHSSCFNAIFVLKQPRHPRSCQKGWQTGVIQPIQDPCSLFDDMMCQIGLYVMTSQCQFKGRVMLPTLAVDGITFLLHLSHAPLKIRKCYDHPFQLSLTCCCIRWGEIQ